jgi:hypothetical protein
MKNNKGFSVFKNKDRILNHFGLPFLFNRVYEMKDFLKKCCIGLGMIDAAAVFFRRSEDAAKFLFYRASVSWPRPKCIHSGRDKRHFIKTSSRP